MKSNKWTDFTGSLYAGTTLGIIALVSIKKTKKYGYSLSENIITKERISNSAFYIIEKIIQNNKEYKYKNRLKEIKKFRNSKTVKKGS